MLGNAQIHKYTKEHSWTLCIWWYWMVSFIFFCFLWPTKTRTTNPHVCKYRVSQKIKSVACLSADLSFFLFLGQQIWCLQVFHLPSFSVPDVACLSAHLSSFISSGRVLKRLNYLLTITWSFLPRDFPSCIIQHRIVSVPKTLLGHNYFKNRNQSWWWEALGTTIAFGARTPQASAFTSSPHHGWWHVRLVLL